MTNWLRRHPFTSFLLVVVLVLVTCATFFYRSWFVAGPWYGLPEDAPTYSQTLASDFAEAGSSAIELLADHRQQHGFPGITAAVAFKGELIWQGGAGWQSLDPVTPVHAMTQLRIGSTSKAVTATAAARLIDRGQLALDTGIAEYFPDPPNPTWRDLTLRQLFSHTAGMPGYQENTDYRHMFLTLCGCRHYNRVIDSLEIFDESELLFEPGTSFHYSSFDTNLIGAVMAEQQQTPYVEVLNNEVFEPLGLTSSGADRDGTSRPNLATFYEVTNGEAGVWPDFDLSQRWPGGGLVSTSADLARIGNAWLDPAFISPATRQAMWTPQMLSNGEINEQSYALGWRFNPDKESNGRVLSYAHHGGVSKGAMSWLVVYPEHHLSIAVNINTRAQQFRDFALVETEIREAFLAVILRDNPGPAS